jgi:outer membrane receptor protein involved in Fe transport
MDDEGNPNNTDGSQPPRIFGKHLTFAISAPAGRIGIDFDGDGIPDGQAPNKGFFVDTNGDGVNDIGQTRLGAEGYGDWIFEDGSLRLFREGQVASFANEFGGDGIASGPFNFQTILPENQTAVANALVRYKVIDRVNFFSDAKFVYSQTRLRNQVTAFNDLLTVSLDNPYIPAELRSALDSAIAVDPGLADTTKLYITRDFLDLGPNTTENERQTFRVVTGFDGKFRNGITYEAAYNYGRTSEELLLRNQRIEDRFFAAIDVVTGPDGQPACRSEVDPAAPPPPTSPFPEVPTGFRTFQPGEGLCKPLNLFGLGAPSQEALDFVTGDIVQNSLIDQHVASLVFTGDSSAVDLKLPAGAIDFAAGGEYRREFSRFRPDEFSETGLVFDGTKIAGVEGSYDVWETFGEVRVPVLAQSSPVGQVDLDAALRFAEYSTVGSSESWKANASWSPIYDMRLRGGYAVAVRAPNVGELFQPDTAAFFRPIDPCDANVISTAPDPAVRAANCAADGLPADYTDPLTGRFAGVTSGNPDLGEERARTFTIGTVLTPRFAPNLIVSADYFRIDLDDAIESVDSQDIVNNCYDDPNGIDNDFCGLFTRNRNDASPTVLGLNFLRQSQLNIGKKVVSGIDFEATYQLGLEALGAPGWGDLQLRLYGSRLFKLDDSPNKDDPSFVNPELREIRRPQWVINNSLQWHRGKLMVNYFLTFLGRQGLDDVEVESAYSTFVNPMADRYFIHDLAASYEVIKNMTLFGGVNNITGVDPIATSTSYPVSPMGRTFFVGVNSRL